VNLWPDFDGCSFQDNWTVQTSQWQPYCGFQWSDAMKKNMEFSQNHDAKKY
jgi:hypothetical protein